MARQKFKYALCRVPPDEYPASTPQIEIIEKVYEIDWSRCNGPDGVRDPHLTYLPLEKDQPCLPLPVRPSTRRPEAA